MVRVRLFYEGEFYQEFLFEKQKQADVLLDAVAAARPDVPVVRDTKPFGT